MVASFETPDGDEIEFECEDTFTSNWVSRTILRGDTYPGLPFLPDVRVVFDVGANCGAATVHFARTHPDAVVHAFEPGVRQRAILERNVAALDRVEVHAIGLDAVDRSLPLYHGKGDSGMSSVNPSEFTTDEFDTVELRAAGPWATERGIDRIDVLKVDAEGCELDIIESLSPFLPTVKALYVEYDSRADRRAIEALLADTHELFIGKLFLDQGECVYLSREMADLDAATDHLRAMWFSQGNA